MIADNRLAEIAIWDDRLLAEQLKELALIGLDFNIEVIGFEMGEIDLRIASLDDLPEPDDLADMVPAIPAGPPLSKIGIYGSSVVTGSCAATLSMPPTSPR